MNIMKEIIASLPDKVREKRREIKPFLKKLAKKKPKQLDTIVHNLHEEAFEKIDCLECANCCKTTSPIFRDKDIDRIAQFLGVRPAQLVEQYLHLDEDNDYVLNQAPCPFLGSDNYCSIYEARPKACREYPHTDRKNFHQILDLSLKNMSICPAVFDILTKLHENWS